MHAPGEPRKNLLMPARRPHLVALGACTAIAIALAAAEAHARTIRLEVGAHYGDTHRWLFDADIGLEFPIVTPISVGLRFGGFVTTSERFGVPVDFLVRAYFAHLLYLELLGGPWIFIEDKDVLAHFGLGFGLQSEEISFGPELSVLGSEGMIGMKLAFRF